jgi:hypothetical protein
VCRERDIAFLCLQQLARSFSRRDVSRKKGEDEKLNDLEAAKEKRSQRQLGTTNPFIFAPCQIVGCDLKHKPRSTEQSIVETRKTECKGWFQWFRGNSLANRLDGSVVPWRGSAQPEPGERSYDNGIALIRPSLNLHLLLLFIASVTN